MQPRGVMLASAVAMGLALINGEASAIMVDARSDYDATFSALCGGIACDQAVAEARNGDNGTSSQTFEWNLGPNTSAPTDKVNVTGTNGFWDGTARDFELSYDGTTLSFTIDSNGVVADETVAFVVDLSGTESMFIRAASRDGQPATVLADLTLNGTDLGDLTGDTTADYLVIYDFDWSQPWTLTGTLDMTGGTGSPQARPSVQFKLTDIAIEVPEPFALGAFGLGLSALGLFGRRRRV